MINDYLLLNNVKSNFLDNFEVVCFDVSGVIHNDMPIVFETNKYLIKKFGGKEISFNEWRAKNSYSPAGFLKNLGIKADEDETYEFYKKLYNEYIEKGYHPKIYPDVKQTLKILKTMGKELAILSSHPYKNLIKELADYGIKDSFDLIWGGERNKFEALGVICANFKIDPEKMIYIGDTYSDLIDSMKVGVTPAWVDGGYNTLTRIKKELKIDKIENTDIILLPNLYALFYL